MKAEYDLSKMKSRKNPYASKLKKSVTMRLFRRRSSVLQGHGYRGWRSLPKPYQSLPPRLPCAQSQGRDQMAERRGLTLPSSGLAKAGRATLVRHFPLRAPCLREPLMSNVRPLVSLRRKSILANASHCFGRISSSRASATPLALPSHSGSSGPSFVIAAHERAGQHHMVFRGKSGASGSGLKEQNRSLGVHSAGLESSGVQASSAQQLSWRPNRSIERTAKGRPRYARSSFSASRGQPSVASHVKR